MARGVKQIVTRGRRMDAQIRGGNAVNGGNAHVNGNGRPANLAGMALFAQNFFTHPRMLGSIVPSSRFLIRRLLASIDWATARTMMVPVAYSLSKCCAL